MSNMASCLRTSLSFIMFMSIGMVDSRWLEVDMFPTSMISDGVSNYKINENPPNLRMVVSNFSESTPMLYAEERCNTIYGFLPCADTMQEGVFLMLMYTYLMMLGEGCINTGRADLVALLGDGAFGVSVFRLLMTVPRIFIVIVSGVLATASDAQNQVAFGVGMYAGSTVITLTLVWGLRIVLSRDKLRGKGSIKNGQKLSVLIDTGVNIDPVTGKLAVIMLLSLIPFATVGLVDLLKSPGTILFSLTVSSVSLVWFFAYQVWTPWIQKRSLAYLKQDIMQTRLFDHIQKLAGDNLIDADGKLNFKAFESFFRKVDQDEDNSISHAELENLINEVFNLKEDDISTEYAKAEVLTHFDIDQSGKITVSEFQNGCSKWLDKWKKVAKSSDTDSKNPWEKAKEVALNRKRTDLTTIEKIMPRILKQVLAKHELVTKNGKPDRVKIEGLFSAYDQDKNQEIHRDELKNFIETLQFGESLDHDTVLNEVINKFETDANNSIHKKEFVDGFIKWIEKAISVDPNNIQPTDSIKTSEKVSWDDETPMKMKDRIASIMYVVFGVGIIYVISGAFVQSVVQFSNAAHMPFVFTSFFMAPLAMRAKMIIMALLEAGSHVSKNASLTISHVSENASLTISEIYSGLVMDNLMGLTTLLATVYIKGLSWSYSTQVLAIIIPCTIIGLFAIKRNTYPLWVSIFAMFLYPVSVYLYYVVES